MSTVKPATGYWGAVTSTVDWCEENYAVSEFVAEFFNSTSSLAIVALGLIGLRFHLQFGYSLALAFFLVFIVGVGSTAFHGTLLHEFQMLDEAPMIYANLALTYCLVENKRERKYSHLFPAALVAFGVGLTVFLWHLGKVQPFLASELFRWVFTGHVLFLIHLNKTAYRMAKSPIVPRLYTAGCACYVTGSILWMIDLNGCNFMRSLPFNPQFHAFWHVFAGLGSYLNLLVIAVYRCESVLQCMPELRLAFGFFPLITIAKRRD